METGLDYGTPKIDRFQFVRILLAGSAYVCASWGAKARGGPNDPVVESITYGNQESKVTTVVVAPSTLVVILRQHKLAHRLFGNAQHLCGGGLVAVACLKGLEKKLVPDLCQILLELESIG